LAIIAVLEADALGDVQEGAVALVAVQPRAGSGWGVRRDGELSSLDEQQVEITVLVEIEPGHPATRDFREVVHRRRAVLMTKGQPDLASQFDEHDWRRASWGRRRP